MSSLFHLLLVILVLGCGLLLYLYFSQSRMLYYPDEPTRTLEATPAAVHLAYDDIQLTTADGIRLHAWFIPAQAPRGTLLFSHGNAGNISHRLDSIDLFHSLGLNVLIYDYRGFGESEGKPTEAGTYLDIKATWDYLIAERNYSAQEIIIFGRSLGAAVAAELASQQPSAGVILESGFTSVPDMAASMYPWLPVVRPLVRNRYETLAKIEHISAPLLIVHSHEDEIIPYSHGERLFAHAREPKQFMELHGGHNNAYQLSHKVYIKTLQQFLDDVLPKH